MASGFTTPPPSGQGRGQRSTGRKRKTQRKSAVKQAKTPLSTLLKKASENRVLRDAKLVSMANHVLASAGLVATVRTPNDVRAVCSSTSVLVASYEAVVGEKITGIIRRPANVEERAQNCDAVIAKLQDGVLGTDLKHISGARITQGNLQDMYDLLEILSALGEKWTFATPIKTPGSRAKTPRTYLQSGERPRASNFRKRLEMEDVVTRAEGDHPASPAAVVPETAAEEASPASSDDGRTLKEKLQDLLVSTVEQKRKTALQEERRAAAVTGAGSPHHHRNPLPASDAAHSTAQGSKRVRFQDDKGSAGKAVRNENERPGSKSMEVSKRDGIRHREKAREVAELLLVHDKVSRYVEFDRAVRKLAEMRFSSGELESRLTNRAIGAKAESDKRMATMRSSWLKSQRAQARHAMALEEKRSLAQQRGLLHSARVESIKARRFQNRVEQLRRSNESRLESAEVAEFRAIFNKAIECEKEIILDHRRQASRERQANDATRLRDRTLRRENRLRKHFEELTEKFKMEIAQASREERQDDDAKRTYEKETRERIAEERERAMEFLAPLSVDAFSSIAIKTNQVETMKAGVGKYMSQMSQMR